jgi:regulatory protein
MPKITSIEEQKKNKKRLSVFIDDQYAFGADAFVIKRNRLEVGKEVDIDTLKKIAFEDDVERAKQYVVDYQLGKPEKQIREKLLQKGYEEEVINAILTFLHTYKLIDDAEYARRYTNDASKLKKHGKLRIKQTLKQKGISQDDIESALTRISSKDEIAQATKMLQSKIPSYQKKAKSAYELRGKCYQYLASRGYSGDVIESAINKCKLSEDHEF